jgi:pyruvate dehydrogenase (quinone)
LQAIGAQVTFPNRQVISFSGDGGFSMMMGELLSIIQLKLPLKIVLLNNGTLGFVELEMKASGFLDYGCDLTNPNFATLAGALGIKAIRVADPKDLRQAATEILGHPGPAVLEVMTPRQELVMPPTTTIDQAKHFGLFMMKAVLDGRATELVDLAKSNLRR